MKTLAQIIEANRHVVVNVGPRESVGHALQLMAGHEVGALLVMDGGKLVGIFSERDYARKTAILGTVTAEALVQDIMTDDVVCAAAQTSTEEAMAIMTKHHIRHLPVLDDYKDVIGVISIRDLVQEAIAAQPFIMPMQEACSAI